MIADVPAPRTAVPHRLVGVRPVGPDPVDPPAARASSSGPSSGSRDSRGRCPPVGSTPVRDDLLRPRSPIRPWSRSVSATRAASSTGTRSSRSRMTSPPAVSRPKRRISPLRLPRPDAPVPGGPIGPPGLPERSKPRRKVLLDVDRTERDEEVVGRRHRGAGRPALRMFLHAGPRCRLLDVDDVARRRVRHQRERRQPPRARIRSSRWSRSSNRRS